MRICERRSTDFIVEAFEDADGGPPLTEAQVEALASEVEALRSSCRLHYTWFDEELSAGRYDDALAGGSLPPAQALPAAPTAKGLLGNLNNGHEGPQGGRVGHQASKGTRLAPDESPPSAPRLIVEPEVWMAAKARRKQNFFAAAVLGGEALSGSRAGETTGAFDALIAVLQCGEVAEALNLGLTSRSFAAALILPRRPVAPSGGAEEPAPSLAAALWWSLGMSAAMAARSAAGRGAAAPAPSPVAESAPFARDPEFSVAAWARHQAFTARVANGAARPALVAPPARELGGCSVELGPFVAPARPDEAQVTSRAMRPLGPDRLVVCDGSQSFQVVDVWRRRLQEVPMKKAASTPPLLRSSLGTHALGVTASWPLGGHLHCVAGNGIFVAKAPSTSKGSVLKDNGDTAFQWLEVPTFADELAPFSAAAARAAARASEEATGHAATTTPVARSPPSAPAPSPAMFASEPALSRLSVPRNSVAGGAAQGDGSPVHAAIAACWPLPGGRVLLLVRSRCASACAGRRVPGSPSMPPALDLARTVSGASTTASSLRGSPPPSPDAAPSAAPLLEPPLRLARQLSGGAAQDGSLDCAPDTWMLQVWDVPAAATDEPAASLRPVATAAVDARVTAVDARPDGDGVGGILLCGLGTSAAEVRALPTKHGEDGGLQGSGGAFSRPLHTWPRLFRGDGASDGGVSHALLRGGWAVVVQASSGAVVACRFADAGEAKNVVPLLPLQDDTDLPRGARPQRGQPAARVVAVRAVGAVGFAVCTERCAFAFDAGSEGGGRPALAAVVELPTALDPRRLRALGDPAVSYFEATPYEFIAVMDARACVLGEERNAVCCLWPHAHYFDSNAPAALAQARHGGDAEAPDAAASHAPERKGRVRLRARVRAEGQTPDAAPEWRACKASALCLNEVLLAGPGAAAAAPAAIDAAALHVPRLAPGSGCVGGADAGGLGLLAVATSGVGVAVYRWGVETSPELERLREQSRRETEAEAARRAREALQLKLQRLQQRLQETARLQEKLKGQGEEALTEEERAKLERRGRLEVEIERLSLELGVHERHGDDAEDAGSSSAEGDDSDAGGPGGGGAAGGSRGAHGGGERAEEKLVVVQTRRREKERQQKQHHNNKRAMQKQRQQNRDRKFE